MEKTSWWYRARRDLISKLLLKSGRNFNRILDAGCGTGSNYDILSRFSSLVYGLDMSREALQFCRGKGYTDYFMTTLGDFRADMKFGLIMLMDVIEHVDDDRAALRNMRAHLEPDGLMIVSVPAYDILWNSNCNQ